MIHVINILAIFLITFLYWSCVFNPFHSTGLFQCHLKISEKPPVFGFFSWGKWINVKVEQSHLIYDFDIPANVLEGPPEICNRFVPNPCKLFLLEGKLDLMFSHWVTWKGIGPIQFDCSGTGDVAINPFQVIVSFQYPRKHQRFSNLCRRSRERVLAWEN